MDSFVLSLFLATWQIESNIHSLLALILVSIYSWGEFATFVAK